MAVMRIITHIIPSTAPPDKCDSLLSAHNIDVPERVSASSFVDPRSGIKYYVQTTFCKEFPIRHDIDVDDLMAKKCEAVPGLVPLKKYNRALSPGNEICVQPGALDHNFPFSLGIPLKVRRSENVTCALGHFPSTNATSDGCNSLSDQSNSLLKASLHNDNSAKASAPSKESLVSNGVMEELISCETDNSAKGSAPSKENFVSNGVKEELTSCENDNSLEESVPSKTSFITNGANEEHASCVNDNSTQESIPLKISFVCSGTLEKLASFNGRTVDALSNESTPNDNAVKELAPSRTSLVSNGAIEKLTSCDGEIVDVLPNKSVQNDNILTESPPNESIQNDSIVIESFSSKHGQLSTGSAGGLISSNGTTMDDTSEIITSIQDLIEPLKKHFVDNKCLLCGFVSTNKKIHSAQNHLITHLTSRHYKCNLCDKTFKSPNALYLHKGSHLGENVPYPCKACDRIFSSRGSLSHHVSKCHNLKSFPCCICKQTFPTATGLRSHYTIHTGEKPYQCDICSKRFRARKNMAAHRTTHMETELNLSCSVCDKKFRHRRQLKLHMNKHEQMPKFKCEFCHKAFNFHSNLLQHKLVHSDVRRHNCEICGMKFKFPHHLKNHVAIHDS